MRVRVREEPHWQGASFNNSGSWALTLNPDLDTDQNWLAITPRPHSFYRHDYDSSKFWYLCQSQYVFFSQINSQGIWYNIFGWSEAWHWIEHIIMNMMNNTFGSDLAKVHQLPLCVLLYTLNYSALWKLLFWMLRGFSGSFEMDTLEKWSMLVLKIWNPRTLSSGSHPQLHIRG